MNTYTIYGLQSFVSKNNSKITIIHATYESENVSGIGVERFMIFSENLPANAQIGATFTPLYGYRGKDGFLMSINIL